MLKVSCCVEMVLRDLPVADRIRKVADTGVEAVEFWGWRDKDLDALEAALTETGLPLAAFCAPGGMLVNPGKEDEFVAGVEETVPIARRLHCRTLIVTTGQELPDVPRADQHAAIVAALKAAAPVVEANDLILVLEPLNVLVDHAGYYLATSAEGFRIVAEVGSPNVKLLYDIYHQQITEGNLIPTIRSHWEQIGHFHAADHPGRNEPGTGEINYLNVFAAIHRLGYAGYVGMEYRPTRDDLTTLRGIVELAAQARRL